MTRNCAGAESKQAEGEDGEAEEAVFREYQRLGHAVGEIDAAVSTVPRGAYAVDASGRVLANPSFRGLDPVHAADLDSFQHFRASAKAHRAVEAEKRDAGSTEFLDPLSEDVPKGAPRAVGR